MSNTIMCKKCDKKSNIQSTPNAVERARNAIGSLVLNQRDIVNAAVENALIATGQGYCHLSCNNPRADTPLQEITNQFLEQQRRQPHLQVRWYVRAAS